MWIAGLDIGTTGCKLTVFDENGDVLGKAYRDYPVCRAVSGHEIDISTMIESVYAVIEEMTARYPDIAGIGVTSFGETFVLTNDAGDPLHNAMLYTDPRGIEECMELRGKLGASRIAQITGLAPHEMYSISKIMWIKKHCPEIYNAAKRIHLIEDFVVWHLTHRAQIDYSLATRTMAFDIRTLSWSREVFETAGIDLSLMSVPVPSGTCAGTIIPTVAKRTGLKQSCLVVSVSHDQIAAAIGAGAFNSSVAVDGAGTVECLTPIYDGLPKISTMVKRFFAVVPYVLPGMYVAYAFSYTGGALIQWCIDTIAKEEKVVAQKAAVSVNQYLEEQYTRDDPTGLLILPHFAGAATPYMDTGAKGAILGLTMTTTVADIYRACMEGVTYEMRINYEALQDSGIHFERLNATGGGAKSKLWMQMKADVLNLPITALKTADAGTVGSAMLTGIAVGLFQDLKDAAAHMVQETDTYYPRIAMHEKYMNIYKRYKSLYQSVRQLM